MTWKDKLKKLKLPTLKLPKLRQSKEQFEVPKEWLPTSKTGAVKIPQPTVKTGKDMVALEVIRKHKYRVPGLRRFNQLLAVFLIVTNFFISQAALMSMTPEIGVLFLGNAYVCLWGLWKSRQERVKLEDS